MRVLILFLAAAAVAAAAAESDRDLAPWRDTRALFEIWASHALVEGAGAAVPTDLWADPEAAPAVARVRHELALLEQDVDALPFVDLVARSRALLVDLRIPDADEGDDQVLRLLPGEAEAALRGWLAAREAAKRSEAGAQEDADAGEFLDFRDGMLVYAERRSGLDQVPTPPDAPPAGAAELRFDGGRLVALAAKLAALEAPAGHAVPEWRTWTPRATLAIDADAHGWRSRGECSGIGLPPIAGAVDAKLLALARPDRQATLAVSFDPARLLALVLCFGDPVGSGDAHAELAGLLQPLAVEPEALARLLTGQVLVQGGWSLGPIPQGAVAATLADAAAAAPVLASLAEWIGAVPVTLAGADQAWSLVTPAGELRLARAGDRLVAGTDAALVGDWLAGTPGRGELDPHAGLQLRLDLPALARQWLPLAYGLAAGKREPLGDDPVDRLRMAAYRLQTRLNALEAAGEKPPEQLSAALAGQGGQYFYARLYGADAARLDRSIAVFVAKEARRNRRAGWREVQLVLRTDAGFRLAGTSLPVEPGQPPIDPGQPLDAAALAHALQKFERRFGPEPADLALTTLPERATFDGGWLPPLPVALRHVPAYRLDLRRDGDRVMAQERGLPLLAAGMLALGVFASEESSSLRWQVRARENQRRLEELRAAHPALFASLKKAGAELQRRRRRGEPIPDHASQLLGADFTAAAVAGFFGGLAPADPTDLDRVGRWDPKPAGQVLAVWAFGVGDGWSVFLDQWGGIETTRDLRDVPGPLQAPPSGAAPTPGGERSF